MSRLRANQITNENANGAPNFPHGITVTGIVTASTASTTMDQIVVGSAVTANSQGIDVTGIVTATQFKGDGSVLTGIDASSLKNGSDVKVQANASGAAVTGILTSPTVVSNKILPIGGIESAGTNIYTGGGIIQIKQFVYKTATSITVSGGTMYDSGVQCTITPHSSSNQIFVVVDMSVGLSNGYGGRLVLRRSISGGSTGDLINFRGTPSGNRPIVTKAFNDHKSQSNEGFSYYNVPIHALDQPNTTSAVTYSIRIGAYDSVNVFVNRSGTFQDGGGGGSDGLGSGANSYDGITVSTMTLMEVSS
tara:strand:+ start:566 stop:1483 length:918 start_codon:yes stop_codon:yes gene_type:complete